MLKTETKMISIFSELKKACTTEWEQYVKHEFTLLLGSGKMRQEAFQHYLIQDYIFLKHFARAYGLAAYKSNTLSEIRAASKSLHAIVSIELELHEDYCRSWDIDRATLDQTDENSATIAYTRYVLDCGLTGDILELYTALLPCIMGYGEIGSRLITDKNTKSHGNVYYPWIEMYGGKDYQALAEEALWTFNNLSDSYAGNQRIVKLISIFKRAVQLEIMFWEAPLHLTKTSA